MDKTDILQDISVDFSQLVKKHIKNIKKLDSTTQKEFGRAFGDMKDLLDDLSETAIRENKEIDEVLSEMGLNENPALRMMMQKQLDKAVVKNPETKKPVKVATAAKDKNHPAHKKAKGFLARLKDKLMKKESTMIKLSDLR